MAHEHGALEELRRLRERMNERILGSGNLEIEIVISHLRCAVATLDEGEGAGA